MKNLLMLVLGSVLSLALLGGLAQAQTTTTTTDPQSGTTPVELPIVRPNLPADVQAMIKAMQAARKAFLDQQKAEVALLKGATADQRAAIRETLTANRETFLEAQKTAREQLATRLVELRKDFIASHQKLVDEIKASVAARVRKGN